MASTCAIRSCASSPELHCFSSSTLSARLASNGSISYADTQTHIAVRGLASQLDPF